MRAIDLAFFSFVKSLKYFGVMIWLFLIFTPAKTILRYAFNEDSNIFISIPTLLAYLIVLSASLVFIAGFFGKFVGRDK